MSEAIVVEHLSERHVRGLLQLTGVIERDGREVERRPVQRRERHVRDGAGEPERAGRYCLRAPCYFQDTLPVLRVSGWQPGQKNVSSPCTPARRIVSPQRGHFS